MERHLSAILAVDVVGYSRLMERDEADTFERLRTHRKELFEPEIATHHGRIFKLMGDGLLAEFGSIVDAVECAVGLQREMAQRNKDLPGDRRIEVRIGINLGEVIVEGDDRHGDGVNIAARLQALAAPGGICVSGNVAEQLRNKPALRLEPMGTVKVKNISKAVEVHRVLLDDAAARSPLLILLTRLRYKSRLSLVLGAVLILFVCGAAAWQLHQALPPAKFPTIAVLPFDNLSDDPEMGYFSDGISEDIITRLSRFPDIVVIARNSSFVYKGKAVDVRQIGRELGADYVLEGSARKQLNEIRLTAQLIDASTGAHVWAERYDASGTNPFALQDAVVGKILVSLTGERGQLRQAEYARAWGTDSANLEEYDYYLRGHDLFMTAETNEILEQAGNIWTEGLQKFPDSSLLRVKLGFYHLKRVWFYLADDPAAEIRAAETLLQEALSNQNLPPQVQRLGHWAMAWTQQMKGNLPKAAIEAKAAIVLAPFDTFMVNDLAAILAMAGQAADSVALLEKNRARDPQFNKYWELSLANYLTGDDGRAIEAALKLAPDNVDRYVLLASSYVRLGQLDEARSAIKTLLTLDPKFNQSMLPANYMYSDPSIMERQAADLALAGLPEK